MSFTKSTLLAAAFALITGTAGAATIGQLGVLDSSTGLTAGDQYRLVFVSSATTTATSTDIATYNAFVQGLANTAGLGGATWNIVGSTATVDARDNTGTNVNIDGVGVPVFLTDGVTLFAADNADIWNGANAALKYDEFGVETTTNVDRIFTGTENNGTKHPGGAGASQVLGGDSGNTQTGRADSTGNAWIRNFNVSQTGQRRVYGMSEILTAVPEPGSLALLSLGGLLIARRRRG